MKRFLSMFIACTLLLMSTMPMLAASENCDYGVLIDYQEIVNDDGSIDIIRTYVKDNPVLLNGGDSGGEGGGRSQTVTNVFEKYIGGTVTSHPFTCVLTANVAWNGIRVWIDSYSREFTYHDPQWKIYSENFNKNYKYDNSWGELEYTFMCGKLSAFKAKMTISIDKDGNISKDHN